MRERAERFFKYMEIKGLNDNQVTVECGLSVGLLNQARSGKSDLGPKTIEKLLRKYQDINKVWLLTGVGDMTNGTVEVVEVGNQGSTLFHTNSYGVRYRERNDGQMLIQVPIVPYNALGSPTDDYSPPVEESNFEMETFEVDRVGHGKYFAFKVDGDSMDDGTRRSFARGDIVLVRELDKTDWFPTLHINRWHYWVVAFGNNIRLKEIISQDGDTITLHSLNPSPEYTDFQLNLSSVSRLFNVIKKKPRNENY